MYKKVKLSKPTGIRCMKKLQERGWIELHEYETLYDGKRKQIKIPNTIGSIFVKCNLNLDLYKILKGACKSVAVKVYLYHCFMGSKHAKAGYTYKQPLQNIARAIGISQTNLMPLVDSNNLLEELGVIKINKHWVNPTNTDINCENIYTFNPEHRTKSKMKKIKVIEEAS